MDDKGRVILGSKIRSAREATGYTRKEFSELLGITSKYLSFLENGAKTPSFSLLARMCVLTRRDFAYFLGHLTSHDDAATADTRSKLIDKIMNATPEQLDQFQKIMELIDTKSAT